MATIRTCDICGMKESDSNRIARYKFKKQILHIVEGPKIRLGWEKIDICTSCLNQIARNSRAKKEAICHE